MASEFKDEGEGEVYEEYEPYSPLRKKGRTDKTLLVAIAIGVGVLALVLALFSFRTDVRGSQGTAILARRLGIALGAQAVQLELPGENVKTASPGDLLLERVQLRAMKPD